MALLDFKTDWQAATGVMGFVAERQVLRPAACAPEIDPGFEGQSDRHAGIDIHLAHISLLSSRNDYPCEIEILLEQMPNVLKFCSLAGFEQNFNAISISMQL